MVLISALVASLVASSPMEVVKAGDAEVQKVLSSPDPTPEKLGAKEDEFIDFGELAKRALGEQWGKLNKKQQEEFVATMKGLLRASYAQRAISDGKQKRDQDWGEEKIAGNEATVTCTLHAKVDDFSAEYRLYRPNATASWRIYDVVTDEVSLVSTYSDQFRQLIAKRGYDGLLTTLKARRAQLEKPEPHAAASP